jgi:hypothetical protein
LRQGLARHIRRRVENPTGQYKATGDFLSAYIFVTELDTVEIGIIGAVKENVVDAAHAQVQWNQCEGSDAVFSEESFGSYKATGESQEDDESAERRCPPTH